MLAWWSVLFACVSAPPVLPDTTTSAPSTDSALPDCEGLAEEACAATPGCFVLEGAPDECDRDTLVFVECQPVGFCVDVPILAQAPGSTDCWWFRHCRPGGWSRCEAADTSDIGQLCDSGS